MLPVGGPWTATKTAAVVLRLRGVFQDVDFNNKERFPDAVLERLRRQLDGVCAKVDAADGQREACQKLLAREAAAGVAVGAASRS